MVERLLSSAELLTLTADSLLPGQINAGVGACPHFDYIWKVGAYDLHDALHAEEAAYVADATAVFDRVILELVLLLVCLVAAAALILLVALRPYKGRVQKETHQVADVLSQLPPDIDVEGMVARAVAMGEDDEDDPFAGAANAQPA